MSGTNLFGNYKPQTKNQDIIESIRKEFNAETKLELKQREQKVPVIEAPDPQKPKPRVQILRNSTGQRIFDLLKNVQPHRPPPPKQTDKKMDIEPQGRKLKSKIDK